MLRLAGGAGRLNLVTQKNLS
ncbi:hypothetical protein SEA_BERKA_7 [Arthrobacter phage Berka]|nr:hypothetical protein SEA_BERKA_7 [Arthrobacter phage Berka]